eukprot:5782264-Amphidinium_carterae.1
MRTLMIQRVMLTIPSLSNVSVPRVAMVVMVASDICNATTYIAAVTPDITTLGTLARSGFCGAILLSTFCALLVQDAQLA